MDRPFPSSAPFLSVVALAVSAFLSGCAAPGATTGSASGTATTASTVTAAPAPAAAPVVVAPPMAMTGPVNFEFEKSSIVLGDDGKSLAARVAERAKAAQRIVITGYCDRSQIGNAREAAIARGTAVRNELVKAGVPAGKIRVKFVTSEAGRHAAEIEFEESRPRGR